jgi:hypothetical protein
VELNAANAGLTRPFAKPKPEAAARLYDSYGRAPAYLKQLFDARAELARAEALRLSLEAEERLTPPGCRLLSPEERDAGLQLLLSAREAVATEERAFPLALNTEWRRRKKRELEERMARLDDAVATFSKPRVYLPLLDAPADVTRMAASVQLEARELLACCE